MIYITTDTHYNHTEKMHLYCGRPLDYEKRIFKEMSKLTEDDVLIHLGDVCVGKDAEMHKKYIEPLKCKKWLTLGNHDKKSIAWYLRNGWDFVGQSFSLNTFGKQIIFSHEPLSDKVVNNYDANFFGHFHIHLPRLLKKEWIVEGEEERNRDVLSYLTPKHHVISLEELNYKLIPLKTLIKQL